MPTNLDSDLIVVDVITALEMQRQKLDELRASTESRLNKRCLSIALTELETAMLWIANARQ